MTLTERKEAERYAKECLRGEPTRIPTRRERELAALVLLLLREIDGATQYEEKS